MRLDMADHLHNLDSAGKARDFILDPRKARIRQINTHEILIHERQDCVRIAVVGSDFRMVYLSFLLRLQSS